MTDPFLLDQKEVEVTIKHLEEAVNVWRTMRNERKSDFSDSLEYEFQGVESILRNGIRDVKWSLDDLEETLKLMSENANHFINSEDLKLRRVFLESSRKALADIEFEVLSPPLQSLIGQQPEKTSGPPANQSRPSQREPPDNHYGQSVRPEEAGALLMAESDENVVFSKSDSGIHIQQQRPRPHHQRQQQKPVSTLVSLNLDTVQDLLGRRSSRCPRSLKSLLDAVIRYRCWLVFLALVTFFVLLVGIKAAARARSLAAGMTTDATAATTTACADSDMNCI